MRPPWRRWLRRFAALVNPRPHVTCPTRRLGLQALEDRTVPAAFNVTTTADVVDANDGLLSLREAVLAANASVGVADTINLPAGNYVLTLTGANEDFAATGDLDVTDTLTIQGAGAASTFIDGNHTDRVFDLRSGALTLSDVTVRNGLASGDSSKAIGGGIRSAGTLTIVDSVVTGNVARGNNTNNAQGGGIYQHGQTLTLLRTTVSGNQALGGDASGQIAFGGTAQGGGVYQNKGTLAITDCTVSGNEALGGTTTSIARTHGGGAVAGAGIYRIDNPFTGVPSGTFTLVESTISGNSAIGGSGYSPNGGSGGTSQGGGVWTNVPASVTGCAVVNNLAMGGQGQAPAGSTYPSGPLGGDADGGGINAGATLTPTPITIVNTTISGNRAIAGDGRGGTNEFGGNGHGGGFDGSGSIVIENSTLVFNTVVGGAGDAISGAETGGGVSAAQNASLVLSSSILAGNSAAVGPDIASAGTVDLRYSAVGSPAGFTPSAASGNNLPFGIDLKLGPLGDNGGPTHTVALLPGSPAIDAGFNPDDLPDDQRGPGFARVVGAAADIGAFEVQSAAGAPSVNSVRVNGGATQRSMVTSLQVTFSTIVTIVPGAFTLTYIGAPAGTTGGIVGSTVGGFTVATATVGGVTVATLSAFTGADTFAGSLIDGRYSLTVDQTKVTANGVAMASDFSFADSGTTSGNQLFRLYGDITGDRVVNGADLTPFIQSFGAPNAAFDFNADGVVNGADLTEFIKRFGLSV